MEARRRGRKLEVIEGEEKEGEKGEGREVSDEMGARSSMDARDAKLAMKGLSETRTYRFPQNRFPQLNSSSTLFSDNRKECGVKMRWERRRGGNRELQEAQNTGEAQQEGRKLQWNQGVSGIPSELSGTQQNSVGILSELLNFWKLSSI